MLLRHHPIVIPRDEHPLRGPDPGDRRRRAGRHSPRHWQRPSDRHLSPTATGPQLRRLRRVRRVVLLQRVHLLQHRLPLRQFLVVAPDQLVLFHQFLNEHVNCQLCNKCMSRFSYDS